jgi:hypothetical protein
MSGEAGKGRTMIMPVARTRDEAHLYMDLHPCAECGSNEVTWKHAVVDAGGELGSAYFGTCPVCNTRRDFVFRLPEREYFAGYFPNFGDAEPSQLLDAGEWLWIADRAAGNAPAGDPVGERRALDLATRAVAEVIKFIPDGQQQVPDSAFWSRRGWEVRNAEPGRFSRGRLEVVRDTYRELASTVS